MRSRDGNERVAFAVMDVFLRLNGRTLEVEDDEAHTHLVGLMERGGLDLHAVDAWLREHVHPQG